MKDLLTQRLYIKQEKLKKKIEIEGTKKVKHTYEYHQTNDKHLVPEDFQLKTTVNVSLCVCGKCVWFVLSFSRRKLMKQHGTWTSACNQA